MIPILYEKNETEFTSNGLGRLRDAISVKVVEERNSIYECDFEYPVDGANYDLIQVGRIIGVSHDESMSGRIVHSRGILTDEENDMLTDEEGVAFTANRTIEVPEYDIQPFDIVSFTRPIDGIVTFHCVHISYRQSYMTVTGSNINSLADAFTLLSNAEPDNPFTYETDKTTSTGYLASADGVPKTVRSILGGVEGSILDAYGGEYEWDRFRVVLHSERGTHRDFSIRYGVNMLDYNEEYDSSGTYMSCVPYWTDGTTTIVGDRQDSSGSTITNRGECVPLDVSDKFESRPTKAQVEAMGLSVMNAKNPMIPTQNIHVEFVRLQDLGYEGLENLLECKLCDTIDVVFPFYNTVGQFKIVKTVWDVLANRYESMELGDLSVTLAEALGISNGNERTSDMTDFVVEEATSGIWTYRKWNNGVSECWGSVNTSTSFSAWVSPIYYGATYCARQTFPTGLFIAAPIEQVSIYSSSSDMWICADNTNKVTSTQTGRYYPCRAGNPSGSTTYTVQFYDVGRWK